MENEIASQGSNWLWGVLWVGYAYAYAMYFGHLARGLKPDDRRSALPGSPERLWVKHIWCNRFAAFLVIPTVLEAIRSTFFTTFLISMAPFLFGIWVMRSVWREVIRSEMPQAARLRHHRR